MKRFFLLILSSLLPFFLMAETIEERQNSPHELRFLVGDMLSESVFWFDDAHANYTGIGGPASIFPEKHNTFWTPHFAGEYQYRFNKWLGFGLQLDFQYTGWRREEYNNQNDLVSSQKEHFYNLSILPTVRFTYFHHPYVNVYSAIGLGLDVNSGTETDIHGKHTAMGAALDIAAVGFSAGKDNWFVSAEVGGLSAIKNKGTIFMVVSRILTIGAGYRF